MSKQLRAQIKDIGFVKLQFQLQFYLYKSSRIEFSWNRHYAHKNYVHHFYFSDASFSRVTWENFTVNKFISFSVFLIEKQCILLKAMTLNTTLEMNISS